MAAWLVVQTVGPSHQSCRKKLSRSTASHRPGRAQVGQRDVHHEAIGQGEGGRGAPGPRPTTSSISPLASNPTSRMRPQTPAKTRVGRRLLGYGREPSAGPWGGLHSAAPDLQGQRRSQAAGHLPLSLPRSSLLTGPCTHGGCPGPCPASRPLSNLVGWLLPVPWVQIPTLLLRSITVWCGARVACAAQPPL